MLQHRFISNYTAFCNLLPNQMKNPVELRLICRESADRTTFSTSNFPNASKECATGAFVNAFCFEHERADTDSRNIGCRVCRVNVHERQVVAHTVLRSGISGKTLF